MTGGSEERAEAFWTGIRQLVEEKVREGLALDEATRGPLIDYLRDLEATARRQCRSRDTIQVIASGRRLLGDRSEIGPRRGPFSAF